MVTTVTVESREDGYYVVVCGEGMKEWQGPFRRRWTARLSAWLRRSPALKTRIVEGQGGRFYPQVKPGLFWFWRCWRPHAATDQSLLVSWLTTEDPAEAANFSTEPEAKDFISRVSNNIDRRLEDRRQSGARKLSGVHVKRVIRAPF